MNRPFYATGCLILGMLSDAGRLYSLSRLRELVLAKGSDIKRFWEEGLPAGYHCGKVEISITDANGNFALELDREYPLSAFGILYQNDSYPQRAGMSFQEAFNNWRQKLVTLEVVVPRTEIKAAKQEIKKLGYKVRS